MSLVQEGCDVSYRENACEGNFVQVWVIVLWTKFNVNESTICIKSGLFKQKHQIRSCTDQWTIMWPEACRNLTVFPWRAMGQYSLSQCLQALYRTQLQQIMRTKCMFLQRHRQKAWSNNKECGNRSRICEYVCMNI